MSALVVRGMSGPLAGVERELASGTSWRVGEPPIVLLTSLGEGQLCVEPFTDGVRVGARDVIQPERLDLALVSARLRLPDGSVLLVTQGAGAGADAEPLLQLDLELAPPPEPARLQPRFRIPRPKLSLPRISLPFRVSRAVGTSIAVHAVLALLLFLILALIPHDEVSRRTILQFRFSGMDADGQPEARQGAGKPDDAQAGDNETADARSADRAEDELAAALDEEAGAADDESATHDQVGAGRAPAGALLSSRRGGRERMRAAGGGDAAADGALLRALTWLARHQSPEGWWDGAEFTHRCRDGESCAGPAERPYREAVTALALMPFLGAGHTHREGPWREHVRDGLAALIRLQREDGSFGRGGKRVYASAMAALVLAEAYGMTGSAILRTPAQRAARYFVRRQSDRGGWRYHPGDGTADTSVTGWVTLALVSARRAGLDVPAHTLDGARMWIRGRTAKSGLVGYTGQGRGTDALLGVGLFCRVLLGADPADPGLVPVATRLAGRLPRWPDEPSANGYGVGDPMHWYYGSLGAFQAGGDTWTLWETRLRELLLVNQRREGCATGSFDPIGSTGAHGGRVIVTALAALCLEVTYRYPRATFGR